MTYENLEKANELARIISIKKDIRARLQLAGEEDVDASYFRVDKSELPPELFEQIRLMVLEYHAHTLEEAERELNNL